MKALRVATIALVLIGAERAVSSQAPAGPSLQWSTYWGGSVGEESTSVAVDVAGNIYVAGTTTSADFPKTVTTLPSRGGSEVFVSKFSPSGALIFSTVFGGSSSDAARGIAVDSAGNIIVVGETFSSDLPVVNAIQSAFHPVGCGEFGGICSDGFAAKIDPTGQTMLFCTYLGTDTLDTALDVAVDSADNIYVVGAAGLPFDGATPVRAFAGGQDAFIAKLPPAGGTFTYLTYLGGGFTDSGNGIAVDPSGNAYVTGSASSNFPVLNPFQAAPENFSTSAFVTKLDPTGSMVYSTLLSGVHEDSGMDVAVDIAGRAHVVGLTQSTNFPTLKPRQPFLRGFNDVFLSVLSPSGSSLVFSTYLGGTNRERSQMVPDLAPSLRVAVDGDANTYVTGLTQSSDFPTAFSLLAFGGGVCIALPDFQMHPCPDAFVSKFDVDGRLLFSTTLGGSRDDRGRGIAVADDGVAYVVGNTVSTNFPVKAALWPALSGNSDAFIAKISTAQPACQLPAPVPLAPTGGIFDPQPTFSWQPVAGANAYAVLAAGLGQGMLLGNPPVQILGITAGTSLTPTTPIAPGDYGWVPVALNLTCGLGQSGAASTFTLPGTCPAPTASLVSPIGSTQVNNPIQLQWNVPGPSVTALSLAVVVTAQTGQFVAQHATTGNTVTIPNTLSSGEYAWVVVTWNSTCGATVSEPSFFRSSGSTRP